MEIKKSPKADLENRRPMFVLIGFVMVLAFMYICFEWTQTEIKKIEVTEDFLASGEEEMIPQTVQENIPPPPPPPPATVVQEVLNIVENNVETTTAPIAPQEIDQTPVVIPTVVAPPDEEDVEEIFTIVENPPSFPGGDKALKEYLVKNLKYPAIAQENGIQGAVYIAFVVNKDGKIVDVQVVRGVDPSLDKEAVRVVQSMPPWNPGKQRGKSVRDRKSVV